MQQVIFIWGWNVYPSREEFCKELEKRDYNPYEIKKRRKSSLQTELWENYFVITPWMPNKDFASYKEWKIMFEKIFPYLEWDSIIIAHSLWTIFIIKYLIENKFPNQIKQLHLVSPLIDNKELPEGENYLGDFEINDINEIHKNLSIIDDIFIYHSTDDFVVPFSQWERLHKILENSKFYKFEDRGHFLQEDFPELIKNIISN